MSNQPLAKETVPEQRQELAGKHTALPRHNSLPPPQTSTELAFSRHTDSQNRGEKKSKPYKRNFQILQWTTGRELATSPSSSPSRRASSPQKKIGEAPRRTQSEASHGLEIALNQQGSFVIPQNAQGQRPLEQALRLEVQHLKQLLNGEYAKNAYAQARHAREMEQLTTEHVQMVNRIGLDQDTNPDDVLEGKFRSLHDRVGEWCRDLFRHQKMTDSLRMQARRQLNLKGRCSEALDGIRGHILIQSILWSHIEDDILSSWYPGSTKIATAGERLDAALQSDTTPEMQEKVDYWRLYTATLLYQSQKVRKSWPEMANKFAAAFLAEMGVYMKDESHYQDLLEDLVDILEDAIELSARLKCLKVSSPSDINPGDYFDASCMTEAINAEEDEYYEGDYVVCCVLSRGYAKSSGQCIKWLCKTRVLVRKVRKG